jgi:hypothetical protein
LRRPRLDWLISEEGLVLALRCCQELAGAC